MFNPPPTIKEIAKKLNISISTVSRALHDHERINILTRIRVQKLAREMDYEPNQKAIFFQKKRTFTIGVILPDLSEYYFSTAISAIEDISTQHKYSVLLGQSHDSEEREKHLVESIMHQRIDGLIISIAKDTRNYDHLIQLKRHGIPIVFFDRVPAIPDIHYVACNVETGTVQAVNFLIAQGHRSIAMINGPESLYSCRQRKEGYLKGIRSQRLKYEPGLVTATDLSREGTEQAMAQLLSLKRKPTAVLCFNDNVTLDAIEYSRKMKLKINKDISFISFSNQTLIKYAAFPPIATIEQYPHEQAQQATELLLDLLDKRELAQTNSFKKINLESRLAIHPQQK
ncbi:MAG: LacI family transcriptional regulator [Sphingobacteriales bacterium 50-39]|nr:LacI family DNA-binding transcriptional regulator [Sphingobacteriales bacterium]OJW57735.1 MAG: LacI family transcriptional regulator [Sphingobacteriales bacterium 50-39]